MNSKFLKIVLMMVVSFFICSVSFADSIPAAVNVPYPSGATPVMTKVINKGLNPSDWIGPASSLDFGPLTYFSGIDPVTSKSFSLFLPACFYAIDVGYAYGGSGSISQISVVYTEGATPQAHGLGWKATATFVKKALDSSGTELDDVLLPEGKQLLKDVNESFSLSTLGGGWLRLYVGVSTKDPTASPADPAEAETFGPADVPGDYNGTLEIIGIA